MNNEQLAWFAGIFEGEGCINFEGINSVDLTVSMQDEDTIRKIQEFVGMGHVNLSVWKKEERHADMWKWNTGKKEEVTELLIALIPWMSDRRKAKALEALERLSNNRGIHQPIDHGTRKGFRMEKTRGIEPCDPCRKAHNFYYTREQRDLRKQKG